MRFDEDWPVSDLSDCASDISSSGNFKDDAIPLSWLITMLHYYTERELTYATDAINAISGLLKIVSTSMKSELLQGLPILALDYMLSFRVDARQNWQTTRKLVFNKTKRRKGFPSWSYAGWEAAINWNFHPDISPLHPKTFNHWLDHGTWIVWFKSLGLDQPVAILTEESLKVRSRTEREVFYSRMSQGDLSGRFGKLDTSKTVPEALTSINPAYLQQQLLRFYTVTVNLTISPTVIRLISPPSDNESGERLSGSEVRVSGTLYDVKGSSTGLLIFDIGDFVTEDGVYELILLSDYYGSLIRGVDQPSSNPLNFSITYPDTKKDLELFWVMLLTWDDGVAERRGIGRVLRSAVENSFPPGPQWREIVLG